MDVDEQWMSRAIAAAHTAQELGEIPVGACIVNGNDEVLAVAGNRTRTDGDPTAHAEIVALRAAAKSLGNYRLTNAVVYSTIEPCAMCAGALVNARIARLVYGAADPKAGAVSTLFSIGSDPRLNHRFEVVSGLLADEAAERLQAFFAKLRAPLVQK